MSWQRHCPKQAPNAELAVYVSKANAASDELAGLQKWFEQACIPGVGETARSYWYVVDDTGEWGLACEKTPDVKKGK